MTHLTRISLTLLFSILFTATSVAQPAAAPAPAEHQHGASEHQHHSAAPALEFIPNRRQWEDRIAFSSELGGLNKLFLEADRFTFLLFDQEQTATLHDRMQEHPGSREHLGMDGHAYSVRFNGAQQPTFTATETASYKRNYLLGNDPSRWAKEVPLHGKVSYGNLYPNVDLDAYSQDGNFKYDFIVRPGGDPTKISLTYEGLDGLRLIDGELVLGTSVGGLRELQPYAYQVVNGERRAVSCHYLLNDQTVSFALPEGYDAGLPLVIDPTVVGATLAGSVNNQSFGHSATSDNAGNMYGAGISFGVGYPTTPGAFQNIFAGGSIDIAVSKFNENGTELIYATYLGGSNAEYPHSTIVDANGQLCLYGTTQSTDYPVSENALQPGLRGGFDIVVTKLSPDGTTLVGSTYLGGTQNDGVNESNNNVGNGDRYRGELVLDSSGDIYVATCSSSADFPVSPNAFQTERGDGNFGQQQDGVVFKINSDLSALFWSTYLGGTDADLASSLRVDRDNNVYVSGFAADNDFPLDNGNLLLNFPGGRESAFVLKLSANGSEILSGTYWGTGEEDRSYFLDTDELDQVHIFGLSQGQMPITDGVFSSGVGANQFVTGFSADLDQVIYSTVIGSPSGEFSSFEFLPVAFMVDKCNGIYVSGHGSQPGLPLTTDAVYTESNSFYLAKLEPDATALTFGSYYGRANHVDGGTSRFDKGGVVYQGVCSCRTEGPGGTVDNVMITSPGAWREDQTTRCDIGVFKIDFDVDVVTAAGVASPSTSGCAPLTIDFEYTGRDGQTISWDFGNGDTGSGENFTYTFEEAGTYEVVQVASSPTSCNPSDTFRLEIVVLSGNSTVNEQEFCAGEQITFLDATTPGASYSWQDGTTAATFQPDAAGTYWVDVIIEGCTRRDTFLLAPLSGLAVDLGDNISLCDVPTFTLDAENDDAVSYVWQDGSEAPTFTTTVSGSFAVTLTDANGCSVEDERIINLNQSAVIDLGPDLVICEGQDTTLDATAVGATYVWQDGSTAPTFTANQAGLYRVEALRDGCPSADSVQVITQVSPELAVTGVDRLCPDEENGSVSIVPTGGGNTFSYAWDTGETAAIRSGLPPGDYAYSVTNDIGCTTSAVWVVTEAPVIDFVVEPIDVPCDEEVGGLIAVLVSGGGTPPFRYSLNGAAYDSLAIFTGLPGGEYTATIRDTLGCEVTEQVTIVAPRDIVVEAGQDVLIAFGDSIRLRGAVNLGDDLVYNWSPPLELSCTDCLTPYARPLINRNTYVLTALDTLNGCFYQDSVTVRVNQDRNVYIPNAFSPNGDGINDRFFVNADQSVSSINYLQVYGRWGGLLYEGLGITPNDPNTGWDGMVNGRAAAGQVVVYTMEVVFLDGTTRQYDGEVMLLR